MSIRTWVQEKIREGEAAFYKELAGSLAKGLVVAIGLAFSFAIPWVRSILAVPVTISRLGWGFTGVGGILFGTLIMFFALRPRIKELANLASIDDLTRVYNSREFQRRLKIEVSRAKRYGHPLSLILVDIDGFKAMKDRHGYETGDMVLRKFAKTIMQLVRTTRRRVSIEARR